MALANMTRAETVELARRIQDLSVGEQAKLLARVILAEGKKVPRSAIRAVQRRSRASQVSAAAVEGAIVQAVRAVRQGRARKRRS
jgi:hypothetical protein